MTTEAKADAPSASAGAGSEVKKDESGIALMTEGRTFTYYYTENDVVNKKELFVYYDSTEGKLGSLLWCEAGKREKIAGQAVPLHYISDVFLGKQTAELQSALAADASSDRCFSIVSKEKNVSLHLRCESPSLRNSFLQGIKEIFSRASTAKTPLQVMGKGASFQYYFSGADGQIAKKEIFLWFDQTEGKLGSLLWNDAGKKEKVNGQVIPLHHISDVFMGKQCTELKSPLASDVLSNQCFSIKSKEIQLNLVAANEKARELWLAGIKEVFTQNANQKKQKQAAAAAAAATGNTANGTTPAATTPVAAEAAAPKEAANVAEKVEESKPDASTVPPAAAATPSESSTALASTAAAEKVEEKPVEKPAEEASSASAPSPAAVVAPVKESAAPAPVAVSSADRDALSILTDGLKLTSYSGSPSTSKEIFLFYENDQPKLGALYWNDETLNREKIAANSILLHRISDVFMGKQSAELKNVSAGSTLCFTVSEKSGKLLHLVARSEKDRKDVLDGIKMIFQKAGKKVDDGKKSAAASNANNAPAAVAAAVPVPSPSRPSDNLLEKGGVFTLYATKNDKVEAKKIFVFVDFSDEKFGCLYYCDEGKQEKIKEQSLPLHLISDVFLGKTSNELKSDAATPCSPNECFSLHTKVRALHLSAHNTQTRQTFLDAIRNVFLSKGKRVEDEKPKKQLSVNTVSAVNSSAAAADLASPSSPGAVHISGRAVNDPLMKGVDVNAYFTESGAVVRRPVHIWFIREDGKYGTLYWSEAATKDKNASRSIPFHLITDVYIGKKTPELASSGAASSVCFGIKAKNNSISIETGNEAQRNELVASVKSVFASVGKQVQEATKPAPKGGKELLMYGQSFNGYFTVDSEIVRRPVWLFYAADDQKMGTLFWNEKEGDRSKHQENSMALHKISDVFLGKQASEFRSAAAVAAPNDHCLSIKTKRIALHLEAKSTVERNNWLSALRSVFTSGGKSVVEDDSLRTKKAAAEFSVGDLVYTPYGNGSVAEQPRPQDGIIAIQSSFGVIYSHFKEVKKAAAPEDSAAASASAAASVPASAPAHTPAAHVPTPIATPAPAAPVEVAAVVPPVQAPAAAPAVSASSAAAAPSVTVTAPVEVSSVAFASPSSVYDDPSLVTDSSRLRAVMENGHLFTGYSMKGDRVISKRMTLWLSTDSDGDTYLYWTPEGAGKVADIDQGVDVEEIVDVKLGKQSSLFTTVPALAHLDADCCLTIVSEQFSVELVADSPKIAKAWVVAIRKVAPKLRV